MEKLSLQDLLSKITVDNVWLNSYKKHVPKFIEEAKSKTVWKNWDPVTFKEFFEVPQSCVCSLRQGYFTKKEKEEIKNHWSDIYPLLKKIAENQINPDWDTYKKLKEEIKNHTKQNRIAATNKLVASLQPNLLCTIATDKHLNELYDLILRYTDIKIPNFRPGGNWFKNSNSVIQFFQDNLSYKDKIDIITYPWRTKDYLVGLNKSKNKDILEDKMNMENLNSIIRLLETKKQIILQGAPGTGKTYYSAEIAVTICDEEAPDTRKELMERYNELVKEGRIAFTTFHQSMDYEEFVEGLKPVQDSDPLRFEVTPGIFKKICEKANRPIIHDKELEIDENVTIWKVSLKEAGDNEVRRDCLDNNRIRIGWSEYGKDFDIKNITNGKQNLDYFINTMEIGDVVLSCYSEKLIDAIGIIEGEYEWDDSFKEKKRVRKVNWIIKDIREDIYELNNNNKMSPKTIHKLKNISINNVLEIIKNYKGSEQSIENNDKPYVLIIDEINRGNISKILGELITLLEADKRIGEENALQAILPYSNEKFAVPSNLYIIGTMNTADRSLGYIDYAIRRRFAFYTLESNEVIIEESYADDAILKKKAISLFDSVKDLIKTNIASDFNVEDLMIGHSYFLAEDEEELQLKLDYEIKPLLREYAFDGILEKLNKDNGKYSKIEELSLEPIQENDELEKDEED